MPEEPRKPLNVANADQMRQSTAKAINESHGDISRPRTGDDAVQRANEEREALRRQSANQSAGEPDNEDEDAAKVRARVEGLIGNPD